MGRGARRKGATTSSPARGKITNRPQKFSEISPKKFSIVHDFLVSVVGNAEVSVPGQQNRSGKEDPADEDVDSSEKDGTFESPAKKTRTSRTKKPESSARSGKYGVKHKNNMPQRRKNT